MFLRLGDGRRVGHYGDGYQPNKVYTCMLQKIQRSYIHCTSIRIRITQDRSYMFDRKK